MSDPVPPPIPYGTKPDASRPPTTALATVSSITKINALYYPNYRVYRGETPGSLNYGYINYVFYAFAHVAPDGGIFLSDEYADMKIDCDGAHGCLGSLIRLKQQYPYLKVILSVGGGGPGSQNFAAVAASGFFRDNFAQSARGLIDASGLDGIDIDWEHPANPEQGRDYVELLAATRAHLPSGRYILTTALPSSPWVLRNIDLWTAQHYLDLINLMAYDFTSAARAGYHAQLYPSNPGEDSGDGGVQFVTSLGFPASKILLGIPCYGRSFLGSTVAGDAAHGNGGDEGTFEYKDLPRWNTEEKINTTSISAFCVGGDGGFTSYDNPETVKIKGNYCKEKGLAGLFYWTGTADTPGPRSLMSSGYRTLHNA